MVMFLHVSFILSTGGGEGRLPSMYNRSHDQWGSASRGSAPKEGSASGGVGRPPRSAYRGLLGQPKPEIHGMLRDMVHKRAVRILLEAFLFNLIFVSEGLDVLLSVLFTCYISNIYIYIYIYIYIRINR